MSFITTPQFAPAPTLGGMFAPKRPQYTLEEVKQRYGSRFVPRVVGYNPVEAAPYRLPIKSFADQVAASDPYRFRNQLQGLSGQYQEYMLGPAMKARFASDVARTQLQRKLEDEALAYNIRLADMMQRQQAANWMDKLARMQDRLYGGTLLGQLLGGL